MNSTKPTTAGSPRLARLLWPVATVVATALTSAVPLVFRPLFYLRGDTDAQFAPTWYHLGTLVRQGHWPPVLDPNAWAGGNYAAEALHGIYNPLNIPVWLLVSGMNDLQLSVYLVKAGFMVLLALGAYLLFREYAASRWAACAMAVAMPFAGYTLFWDAGSWPVGLLAFAYTAWTWWAFHRVLRGAMNSFWGFGVGALAVLQGYPYGVLGVVIVGLALVIEGLLTRNRSGVIRIMVVGVCVACFLPLVFLPLLSVAGLTVRDTGQVFSNNDKMRPALGDLLGLGSPTFVPSIRSIRGQTQVPAAYLAWFVLPVAPWLRWSVVRERGRELVGAALVALCYTLLMVGPSKLWLFRWPLRLIEYVYLPVALVLALLLSAGLARDRWVARSLASVGLVLVGGYLTWAQDPTNHRAAFVGTLLLLPLGAVLLLWHRLAGRLVAGTAAILLAGTATVAAAQVWTFGENAGSRPWHMPTDVSAMRTRFAERQTPPDSAFLQFADVRRLQTPRRDAQLRAAWKHFLAGSMYQVAGVDSVNAYTGVGYQRFLGSLCMAYDGQTRRCGLEHAFRPLVPGHPPLVDLMRVSTITYQNSLTPRFRTPAGWRVVSRDAAATTIKRTHPLRWPGSRLSWVSPGVHVSHVRTTWGTTTLRVSEGRGGDAVFANIDWPGIRAELDGRPLTVHPNRAGLVVVSLPPRSQGTMTVSFRPPHQRASALLGLLGLVGAGAFGLVSSRTRRRGRAE